MYAFAAAALPSPAWAALSHMHKLDLVHRGMFALHMPTPFPLLHAASRNHHPLPPPPPPFIPLPQTSNPKIFFYARAAAACAPSSVILVRLRWRRAHIFSLSDQPNCWRRHFDARKRQVEQRHGHVQGAGDVSG